MLDETNPAEESASTTPAPEAAAEAPAAAPEPAKKAAKKAPAKKAPAKKATTRKTAAKKAAEVAPDVAETAPDQVATAPEGDATETEKPAAKKAAKKAPAKKAPAKKATAKKTTTRKAAAKKATAEAHAGEIPADEVAADVVEADAVTVEETPDEKPAAKKTTARKAPAKKTAKKAPAKKAAAKKTAAPADEADETAAAEVADTLPLFQAPEPAKKAPARRTRKKAAPVEEPVVDDAAEETAEEAAEAPAVEQADEAAAPAEGDEVTEAEATETATDDAESSDETESSEESGDEAAEGEATPTRRRRRRGGRRRRRSGGQSDNGEATDGQDRADGDDTGSSDEADGDTDGGAADSSDETSDDNAGESSGGSSSSRRRRRRRRAGDNDAETSDDPENTVTRVRKGRTAEDQITSLAGSTRLEAKKQRRREGREAGRRRAPIVSEAEFLARREAVDRTMVIRQREDLTQIAVLEDRVLVEHYVARESQTSIIGNVYLGRVQNVLPSMEAAFIDIGKGRNAVLYAGEVNWSSLGHKEGQPRKIEAVLSPGQSVLVQVTKDPIGHKGARLTSQVSLAGRFLVYVPDGTTSGISRKLPDTERARLKSLLKEIVPDSAGVIVRTAAEGASEEELTRDVERLKARWDDIEAKRKGNAPQLLYGEPDLTLKVVRDLFTEDFSKLVIEGDDAWQTVQGYVEHVAPDLADRLERYAPADNASAQQGDVFSVYRIDEQIAKGLDRKVWLPSGGSLIIDRTEAMTVVDVNTGKFTGSGGNLEETVTKNNLEAAEEIVRQLRLRDIGGIIVVDFIDMVLEANRDLVVRRLVECLGRDRTRHQVAEVTSLGLVQMTRKRIGTGLLETFSTDCEHCKGRGLVTHSHPVDSKPGGGGDDEGRRGRRRGRGSDKGGDRGNDRGNDRGSDKGSGNDKGDKGNGRGQRQQPEPPPSPAVPSPKDVAAVARPDNEPIITPDEVEAEQAAAAPAPVVTQPPVSEPVETAPVDTAPKVVTRTRARRGVSRPTTVAIPVVVETTAAPAAPAPAVQDAPEAPAKPQVVTRTRGGARKS